MTDRPARKIIHVDMDAFFASVEQRDDPALRGRPVAVGGSRRRGVVAAASYEARRFGVRSAMPSVVALRQCPDIIFVPPRFEVYRAVSKQIRTIFESVADAVEPLSLDEAYLDVTQDAGGFGSATATARHIRSAILEATGLTASAGVATSKLVAKLASDQNKPDGLTVIRPGEEAAFVQSLSVRRLHGVGPVLAARLEGLGLFSGADLAGADAALLVAEFGRSAGWLTAMAHGIDDRPVVSHRPLKSLGAERTYDEDLADSESIKRALDAIADTLWERAAHRPAGRTLTLKWRTQDFKTVTRAITGTVPITCRAALDPLIAQIANPLLPPDQPIRLLGLTISGFPVEQSEEDAPLLQLLNPAASH